MTRAQPSEERAVRRIAFGHRLSRWDVKVSPYLYISPFFVVFALVGLFPLLYTAWVSVHEWNLIGGQGEFVGLENFTTVMAQPYFWISLRNTFSIFLFSAVPQMIFAIAIAGVLDSNLRSKTFWRMGVLLPYIVAPVAVALIFNDLFGDRYGLFNQFISAVGLEPIRWHVDIIPSHIAIATMVNFRWTGYNALIFLAAMQAIPRDYYEAAVIDGANRLRTFWSITLPLLRPTMIFVIVTSTIGGLQIFDEPRMFDQYGQGGASRQWQTLTLYIYELGWNQRNFGRASAVAWLLFLIIIVFALLNFILTRRIASNAEKFTKPRRGARKQKVAQSQSVVQDAAPSAPGTPFVRGPEFKPGPANTAIAAVDSEITGSTIDSPTAVPAESLELR